MMLSSNARTVPPPVTRLRSLAVITLVTLLAMFAAGTASHASVGLDTAESFAVLAGETITNTGPTTITGDIGLHPGTAFPGNESVTRHGGLFMTDAVAEQAKVDLVTAYNDAAGRTSGGDPGTELGGQTLVGGVYGSGSFGITGTLTLNGQNNPDAYWVFQAGSTLITASNSNVNLINGANVCNVFWQVGSSATLGTGSDFAGTIMALTSITLDTGATVEGRVLARNGAVTMDSNVISNADCTDVDHDDGDDGSGEGDGEDDDTTTGTGGGDTTGTGGGDTTGTGGGDTTGQVGEVPSGGVAAGGGPGTNPGSMSLLVVVLLTLVAVGGTAGIAVRRRIPR